MRDSAFANNTDFMKTIQHEIDRIEESAPNIPGFIEVKIGAKCTSSPSQSPGILGAGHNRPVNVLISAFVMRMG